MITLSDSELMAVLKDRITQCGSARQAAISLEISESQITLLLQGKRRISPTLAQRLGYLKAWVPANEE